MANKNFVVKNGLEVGSLVIFAGNGDISTPGNVTISGAVGVSSINKNDSSLAINDTGSGSSVVVTIDGTVEQTIDVDGIKLPSGDAYYINSVSVLSATALGSTVTSASGLTSIGSAFSDLTAQGNLTVVGNLTVQGNTLTIGSNNLTVTDSIIDLHTFANLAPLVSDDGRDIGVRFHYYKGADLHAFLGWENDTQTLIYLQNSTESNSNISGTYGNVQFGSLLLSNTTAATSATTGALQVRGGVGVSGNIYIGGSGGNAVISTGDIYNQGNIWATAATNTGLKTNQTTAYVFNETATTVKIGGAGVTAFNNNTQAISTTTGALQITGGVSINTGNLFIGGSAGNAITVSGNIIPSGNVVATNNIGSDTRWWGNFYGVSTQARYADLAENYMADLNYEPGTVLAFGGVREVTIAGEETTRVAGVVSTNPAHLMNGALKGTGVVPLALQGRVPCKVVGTVNKGDMMVSAGYGFAKASSSPIIGTVIGKALEDFNEARGTIEIVVGRL